MRVCVRECENTHVESSEFDHARPTFDLHGTVQSTYVHDVLCASVGALWCVCFQIRCGVCAWLFSR